MEYQIPYPRRYDQSLNPAGIVNVIDASVNMSLTPLSTAALIVPENEELPLRSWVEMFTSAGSAGIFRVRSPGREFRNGTKEYDLDHAIAEVGDYIIKADFEENDYATAVIPHLFAYYGGSKWQLGTVAAYEKINVVSRYGDVLSAICSALDQLPDYMMAFDFTTTPWTVSIVARPGTVAGEARLTRNIASLRITEDDSELCTRIYGDGLGANGYIDADTISTYGVIERYAAKEDEEQTDADFLAQCQKYLNQYKNPLLTINIEEQDLQQATNEPLDGAKIGYMFRLVLPDYGITQTQRVHLLTWRNVYSNPGLVTVSMSNQPLTLNSYLYSSASSAASSHRRGGSSAQLKYSMIAQDKHITEQGEILHAAGLEIDPHGVWLFAKEEGVNTGLGAEFKVHADGISSLVQKTGVNELGESETLYSYAHRTAEQYESVVGRVNGHESRIRQTETDIELKADNVTVTALRTTINNLVTGVSTAQSLRATRFVLKGYGCDWFTVNANNGIFRLVGTYDE